MDGSHASLKSKRGRKLRQRAVLAPEAAESKSCDEFYTTFSIETLCTALGQNLFTHDYAQLRRYAEAIARTPEAVQVCVDLVLASRSVDSDPIRDHVVTTAASNAISILNYGSRRALFRFHFSDWCDWSGIRVPGANLNHAVLANCNFDLADVSGSSLYQVVLHGSTFQQANLSGIMTRETRIIHNSVYEQRHIAISSDGQIGASSMQSGDIGLWDLAAGTSTAVLKGHSCSIVALSLSPDGQTLRSASTDGTVCVWNVATHQCISTVTVTCSRKVAFSSDVGHQIVTAQSNHTLRTWDTTTSQGLMDFKMYWSTVESLAWSPDSRYIGAGLDAGEVYIWDTTTADGTQPVQPMALLEGHTDIVWAVAFSLDSQYMATGSKDSDIRIWDVVSRGCIAVLQGHTAGVLSVLYLRNGRNLISAAIDGVIRIWDLTSYTCVAAILEHPKAVTSLSLTADGNKLVSATLDRTMRVWDMAAIWESSTCAPEGHSGPIQCLAATSNGRHLASGSRDTTIRIWDLTSGECLKVLTDHTESVDYLSYTLDDQFLVSAERKSDVIRVWDATTWQCTGTLEIHHLALTALCENPTSQYLVSGSRGGDVRIWDIKTFTCKNILRGHDWEIVALAVCPNNRYVAARSIHQAIRVWNVDTNKCIATWEDYPSDTASLDFSPCGQLLASAGGMSIRIWTIAEGSYTKLPGHEHIDTITRVQFYHDSSTLISGSIDNVLIIWDISSQRSIAKFRIPGLTTLRLIPSSLTLATASYGHAIQQWKMVSPRAIDEIREVVETKTSAPLTTLTDVSSCDTTANETSKPSEGVLRLLMILGSQYPTDLSADFTGAIMDNHLKDMISMYK